MREAYVKKLERNPLLKSQHSVQLRRSVILEYSYLARFEMILSKLDLTVVRPAVSIVLSTMRPDFLPQIATYINSLDQTYCDLELIAVLHGDEFNAQKVAQTLDKYDFKSTIIQRPSDSIFGDNLNLGVAAASGEFITKMDDDDLYGSQHLNDLLAAYYFSCADIVGKWSHWVLFEKDKEAMVWVPEYQETYARHLPGGTLFTTKRFLSIMGGFGSVRRGIDSELYRRADARGATLYSTHPYNYIRVRHGDHTYNASNADFRSRCVKPIIASDELNKTFI